MVEFVGLVKVNVVRGTNLVVRDVMTSDPYVILALGHQVSLFYLSCDEMNSLFHKLIMQCSLNICCSQ